MSHRDSMWLTPLFFIYHLRKLHFSLEFLKVRTVQSHPCVVFNVVFALLVALSVAAAHRIVERALHTDRVILFGDAVKAIFCVTRSTLSLSWIFGFQAAVAYECSVLLLRFAGLGFTTCFEERTCCYFWLLSLLRFRKFFLAR